MMLRAGSFEIAEHPLRGGRLGRARRRAVRQPLQRLELLLDAAMAGLQRLERVFEAHQVPGNTWC